MSAFTNNFENRFCKNFGSIAWAIGCGERAVARIQKIAKGGYKAARVEFDFYSDKRTSHGQAVRAANVVSKLVDAKPWYLDPADKMIYGFDFHKSIEKG